MLNQYKILLKSQNLLKSPRECMGFPGGSDYKEYAYSWDTWVWSLCWEDPLEKEMTTPPVSYLEKSMDRGAWRAIVHAVTKSQTQYRD